MRITIFLAAILGLIWFGAGLLTDVFWCVGCQRSVVGTHALIALTYLIGLASGLFTAAWAQVGIEHELKRAELLRRARDGVA